MDPYYTSPSYYYQPSCPVHDTYIDPYCSYSPPTSTPSHPCTSYYYPSYVNQSSPQVVLYNNSTPNIHTQPSPPVQTTHSTPIQTTTPSSLLNTTFELAPPIGRCRRQRTVFSKDQVDILDQVFEKTQYPDIQLREELSQKLDVAEARIQVWFKNRRSRARTTNKIRN